MHTYVAVSGATSHVGGWISCCRWADEEVGRCPDAVVTVFHARPGEPQMRVVAEIFNCGRRIIADGQYMPIGTLDFARA